MSAIDLRAAAQALCEMHYEQMVAGFRANPPALARLLRDLLSGPEWEGLGEALHHAERAAENCDILYLPDRGAILRELSDLLEVSDA